jgi:hypothetical protein
VHSNTPMGVFSQSHNSANYFAPGGKTRHCAT